MDFSFQFTIWYFLPLFLESQNGKEDVFKILTAAFYVTSQHENTNGMLGEYLPITDGRRINAKESSRQST